MRADFTSEFEVKVERIFKDLATVIGEAARVGPPTLKGGFELLSQPKTAQEVFMKRLFKQMWDRWS